MHLITELYYLLFINGNLNVDVGMQVFLSDEPLKTLL